jgi:hypothetical protein
MQYKRISNYACRKPLGEILRSGRPAILIVVFILRLEENGRRPLVRASTPRTGQQRALRGGLVGWLRLGNVYGTEGVASGRLAWLPHPHADQALAGSVRRGRSHVVPLQRGGGAWRSREDRLVVRGGRVQRHRPAKVSLGEYLDAVVDVVGNEEVSASGREPRDKVGGGGAMVAKAGQDGGG